MQVSMSGISVSEDAVNLFYYMKAKSTVRPALFQHPCCLPYQLQIPYVSASLCTRLQDSSLLASAGCCMLDHRIVH